MNQIHATGIHTSSLNSTLIFADDISANYITLESRVDAKDGYFCYAGMGDTTRGNTFNFNWTGSNLDAWIDYSHVGTVSLVSDQRVKQNINDMSPVLDKIKQLRPVTYNWKDVGIFKDDGQLHLGLVAQEVAEIFPSAAAGDPEETTVDLEGAEVPQPMSLVPNELIAIALKGIQELTERVEALES
jgi:hypothetical protein